MFWRAIFKSIPGWDFFVPCRHDGLTAIYIATGHCRPRHVASRNESTRDSEYSCGGIVGWLFSGTEYPAHSGLGGQVLLGRAERTDGQPVFGEFSTAIERGDPPRALHRNL